MATSASVTAVSTATPAPCPTDVKNHGAYVSSVAHDKSLKGRAHGQAVSAAAHSDCGKTADDAAKATDSTATESESPEPTESAEAPKVEGGGDNADSSATEQPRPAKSNTHGKGHG